MGATFIFRACVALAALAYTATGSAAEDATGANGATGAPSGTHNRDFTYGVDAGIGYSDNITQTSTNIRSEEIFSAGVQFSGLEQGARFQGEMVGDLEHFNYLQNTYSPELIGNFNGLASYTLVPDRLRWMIEDSFGEGLVNAFAAATPDNREQINSVTTGPTLTLPLDAVTLLSITARYTRVSYQTSPLDNNDYGGGISLARLLSARSRVSVHIESKRYDYTDPINPNYDEREAFVRYDIQGARTRLTVDAGYEQLRGTQVNSSGALGRLSVSRLLAPGSQLSITAGRDFSSSSAFVAQSQGVSGVSLETTPGRQSSTPFTNEYETLNWTFTRRRTGLSLYVSHFKQEFQGQVGQDDTVTDVGGRVSRVLYPAWTAGVYADYSRQTFAQQGGDYHEVHGGADLKWQVGRRLSVDVQYDRFKRTGELALFNFSENRVFLRLQYGNGTPRTQLTASDMASAGSLATDPFNIQMPAH